MARTQKEREFAAQRAEAEARIKAAREARTLTRTEIADAYTRQAEFKKQTQEVARKIREEQQRRVEEELMFKKLKLERVAASRSALQKHVDEKQAELQVVGEELLRRDGKSEAMLSSALQRADEMREALQRADESGSDIKQMWLEALGRGASEESTRGEHASSGLIEELQAHRQRALQKSLRDRADRVKELNAQRMRLSAQRKEKAAQAQRLQEIKAKGPEYLMELELGNAPGMEFMHANTRLASGRDSDNDSESSDDEPLSTITQRLQRAIPGTQERVAQLRAQRARETRPPLCAEDILPGRILDKKGEAYQVVTALLQELVVVVHGMCHVNVPPLALCQQEKKWHEAHGAHCSAALPPPPHTHLDGGRGPGSDSWR